MAKKMQSGKFDLNDLADQLQQMQKMGGMGGIMGMMPGMGKMKDQMAAAGLDDKMFEPPARHHLLDDQGRARQSRSCSSTRRKKRIAAGSGTDAAEINKLLKMHRGMADMMKAMGGKGKGGGLMRGMMGGLASQDGPWRHDAGRHWAAACPTCRRWTPSSSKRLQKQAQAAGLGGMEGPARRPSRLGGGGLPGLPGGMKLPGLPAGPGGLPGLGKKK